MSEPWATVADLRSWAGPLLDEVTPADWTPEDLTGLIDRAQEDVRAYLRLPLDQPPGLIEANGASWVDPLAAIAANRAVCDQAVYRLQLDESALVEGSPQITTVGGVSFSARAPDPIAPQALRDMAGVASLHLYRSGCADPDPPPPDAAEPD